MLLYISQQADPICANTTNISNGTAGDLTTNASSPPATFATLQFPPITS